MSRATRAHILLYGSVMGLIISIIFSLQTNNTCDQENLNLPPALLELKNEVQLILSKEKGLEDIENSDTLSHVVEKITEFKTTQSDSKTSLLWLQYLHAIEIFLMFLKAERTSNWELHLKAVREMMPYFAASGHHLYTKASYLYLQTMQNLPITHPRVQNMFEKGFHSIRRSDHFWAGLSTDLVIEQALMRSVKSTGGLTRGRGINEVQRSIWLLSTPATAEINRAMQEFSGVKYHTSDQHKEVSSTRIERDHRDALKIFEYLLDHNPFEFGTGLVNISTGEVAAENVNVYNAREIGESIIQGMKGCSVFDYSFKKKDMAVTMKTKASLDLGDMTVQIDPQLFFQRLIIFIQHDDIKEAFSYELSTRPSSLFDKQGLMNEANKAELAHALAELPNVEGCILSSMPDDTHYVIDGGSLLQKVPWTLGNTYQEICDSYNNYLLNNYGSKDNITVVFDGGYFHATTKDTTHLRRTKGKHGKKIIPSLSNHLTVKKNDFLLNNSNKQAFLLLLGSQIENEGIKVQHASGDADLPIVAAALEIASKTSVTVVGEDTDLLVLLLYHYVITSHKEVYLFSNISKKAWDIKKAKQMIGYDTCKALLSIHALGGCDTT